MTAITTTRDAALELAALGYAVHPLRHGSKAPATENGHLDASTDPATIRAMWREHANIGIALAASGLLVIAPDCAAWLEEFEKCGLPYTMAAQSGSGVDHRHAYYRLPDGGPVHRLCVAHEYDILSNGYVIAPPSVTTGPYTWLTPLRPVVELPEAPAWAVEMLLAKIAEDDAKPPPAERPKQPLNMSDRELLDFAMSAKNGEKVRRLFQGDQAAHDGRDRSHSGADLALLSLLTYYSQDEAQLDRLYLASGLARPEHWRGSYRRNTLDKALNRTEFYEPAAAGPTFSRNGLHQEPSPDAEPDDAPAAKPWPVLVNLPPVTPPAPALAPEMLPVAFRGWLADVAERGAFPLESVAAPALVALGVVVGRQLGIRPGQEDDFLVIPNLWGGDIDRPGMMKTSRGEQGLAPLRRLAAQAHKDYEECRPRAAAKIERIEAELAAIRDAMKAAAKKQESHRLLGLESDLYDKQAELREAQIHERRYLTHDATVEKLGELLRDNPRGLLVVRDELAGFLRTLDKPGREGDREFYLEAWNGTGGFVSDRIARGTVHMPAVCVSIFGGVQPGKLRRYLSDAMSDGAGADGLLQRFQLLIWPETVPWQRFDRPPNHEAYARAVAVFANVDRLDPSTIGATIPEEGVPYLRFDAAAQTFFDTWRDALEQRLRSKSLESAPAFEAHLAKYRSLMPSLALLFHVIETVDRTDNTDKTTQPEGFGSFGSGVARCAAENAAAWCALLEGHARKIYAVEINRELIAAHELVARIKAGDVSDGMPVREIYRKGWSKLTTEALVEGAAKTAETCGWCRIEALPAGERGGRPSNVLRIHPALREAEAA